MKDQRSRREAPQGMSMACIFEGWTAGDLSTPQATIVLPDTGPLITLAVADRLDLLSSFGRPVMIPDVVRDEAIITPGSPGQAKLERWFNETGHNQYTIIDTPLIDAYRRMKAMPPRPDGTPETTGMGEATLMWIMMNIERFHDKGAACLVLTEDGRAGRHMPERVHALSTRSWLAGLESMNIIPSADGVLTAVEGGGRTARWNDAKIRRFRPARRTPTEGKEET